MMKKNSKNERQSFTFYLSFYKAIRGLKSRERLIVYDAIVEYSLLGKEPEGLSPIAQSMWDLIEPTLSKSRTNFLNACKTPHPTKQQTSVVQKKEHLAPGEQFSDKVSEQVSEQVSTDTYTDTETETETETRRDTNTDTNEDRAAAIDAPPVTCSDDHQARPGSSHRNSSSSPSKSAKVLIEEYLKKIRSDVMRQAIGEWLEYKRERGEAYRTMRGMQTFCLRLKELSDGNEYRAQQILQNSIANNWSGIFPLKDDYVPKAQRGEGYMRGYS